MMRPRSYLVGIAYCALLALGAILLSRKPVETFDGYMYAYIASGNDAAFRRLPELPPVYRAMSEATYQEQGPYYRVKPLFQMAVNVAASRVDAIRATHLVALGC